jgi:hypothetical protein
MVHVAAPIGNTDIVHFTAHVPFFLSHLAFGAVTGAWTYH